jgi:hypothetical protein
LLVIYGGSLPAQTEQYLMEARLARDPGAPVFGAVKAFFNGVPAPPRGATVCGFSMLAGALGPLIAVMEQAGMLIGCVRGGEEIRLVIPARNLAAPVRISATVVLVHGMQAEAGLALGKERTVQILQPGPGIEFGVESAETIGETTLVVTMRTPEGEAGIRWKRLACTTKDR